MGKFFVSLLRLIQVFIAIRGSSIEGMFSHEIKRFRNFETHSCLTKRAQVIFEQLFAIIMFVGWQVRLPDSTQIRKNVQSSKKVLQICIYNDSNPNICWQHSVLPLFLRFSPKLFAIFESLPKIAALIIFNNQVINSGKLIVR